MGDAPLEIKVVYDSRDRGRLSPRTSTAVLRAAVPSRLLLGFVAIGSLLYACGAYYITWWKIDQFLYTQLIMKTPVVPVDAEKAAALFGLDAPDAAIEPAESTATAAPPGSRYDMKTTQVIIAAAAYGWLTLATVAACGLAISSGSAWARLGGAAMSRAAVMALVFTVLILALAAWSEWRRYGATYPPDHLRLGMGGLVFAFLALGATLRFRIRGAAKWAAFAVILAALGTIAALYLGGQAGAIEPNYTGAKTLAVIFAAVSLWGWILLIAAPRLR